MKTEAGPGTKNIEKGLAEAPAPTACFDGLDMYNNGVSDVLFDTGLCLPSGSNTSNESLLLIVQEIKKCPT